jgi:hypothetical protein
MYARIASTTPHVSRKTASRRRLTTAAMRWALACVVLLVVAGGMSGLLTSASGFDGLPATGDTTLSVGGSEVAGQVMVVQENDRPHLRP